MKVTEERVSGLVVKTGRYKLSGRRIGIAIRIKNKDQEIRRLAHYG